MELRRLIESDLDSYYASRLQAMASAPTAFLTSIEEERAQGPSRFAVSLDANQDEQAIFGAVDKGRVVGSVGLLRQTKARTAHKAWLWGVFVDSEYRAQGLAGKLIDLAIQHAREKLGVKAIYLSVESTNRAARKLYESRGFRVWGVEPMAMFDGERFYDDDHMVLNLPTKE